MASSASGSDARRSSPQYESYVLGCRPSPHVLRVVLESSHRRVRPLRSAAGGASLHMRHCATLALSHIALASPAFYRSSFLLRFWLWFNTTSRQLIPPQSTHGYRTSSAQPCTCTRWSCKPPAPHHSWQSEDSILHPSAGGMHLDSHEFNMWILAQRAPPACRPSSMFVLSKLTCGRARLHAEG